MQTCTESEVWSRFLEYAEERCSATAYANWLSPIRVLESTEEEIALEVPNIFVQEYLLDNYAQDLALFLPIRESGEPAIRFVIAEAEPRPMVRNERGTAPLPSEVEPVRRGPTLNPHYRFDTFFEGSTNQFVKSAAMGVARRPGRSYNPLFIYGEVGLGKTHLLHSIGHYVQENYRKLGVQCITTEAFINEVVVSLRGKSIHELKEYYRSREVLLIDDIQFLQNRPNFEEEVCNTFEALINQNKQIVITSDKPPGQLKLSERMVARMEWGLVACVNLPDLETRVAILQHKAEARGLKIPSRVAFYIGERINNVRQLEGAVNRICAHCRILNVEVNEELVERTLGDMLQCAPRDRVTVEQVLKAVATIFQVRVSDIKGTGRTKEIALARQVAMYLARQHVAESLQMLGAFFGGRTHSTIIHACRTIEQKVSANEMLRRQVEMARRNIEAS